MKKYDIIYADPPWTYNSKENLTDDLPYNQMTLDQLKKMDIESLCKQDCLLFLWVVSPMLPEGLELLKSWGFKYGTIAFVWHKQRANMGHYTMSECEIVIVGKKGRFPKGRWRRNVKQFISQQRTTHSKKPHTILLRIEEMYPRADKLDLFAREWSGNWDVFGNELGNKTIKINNK